jgi:hypothetical protein
MEAIQEYCKIVKNGTDILKDKVSRLYPSDNPKVQEPGTYVS